MAHSRRRNKICGFGNRHRMATKAASVNEEAEARDGGADGPLMDGMAAGPNEMRREDCLRLVSFMAFAARSNAAMRTRFTHILDTALQAVPDASVRELELLSAAA